VFEKNVYKIAYIKVDRLTLNMVINDCEYWASGDGNICITTDSLLNWDAIPSQLKELVEDDTDREDGGGDIVLHV
jgi:hypothetical protein